jgi:hypothetical protein
MNSEPVLNERLKNLKKSLTVHDYHKNPFYQSKIRTENLERYHHKKNQPSTQSRDDNQSASRECGHREVMDLSPTP